MIGPTAPEPPIAGLAARRYRAEIGPRGVRPRTDYERPAGGSRDSPFARRVYQACRTYPSGLLNAEENAFAHTNRRSIPDLRGCIKKSLLTFRSVINKLTFVVFVQRDNYESIERT